MKYNVAICPRSPSKPPVKNCEVSEIEILTNLQISKLAWHSFMNAGIRHETPGLEKKEFILHSNSSGQRTSIWSQSPKSHKVMWRWSDDTHSCCVIREEAWAYGTQYFITGSNHAFILEILSLSYIIKCYKNIFEKVVQNKEWSVTHMKNKQKHKRPTQKFFPKPTYN